MKKHEIKKILNKYYKPETVRKLIDGKCFPSLKKAISLQRDGIPVEAWEDIKIYINETIASCNDTSKIENNCKSMKENI